MAAVAHNPGFAKKVGVPVSVGQDFNAADTGTGILKKPHHNPMEHGYDKLPFHEVKK